MRWNAQVLHVARKDVRQHAWLLASYAAAIAFATAALVSGRGIGEAGALWMIGLTLAAMVIAGLLVQADPPASANAFWRSLPLRPSAVMAAKLLVAAVFLVGTTLIGQLVLLVAHDVRLDRIGGMLAGAASAITWTLAFAALAACVARDVRGFAVTLVAIGFAWLFVMQVIGVRYAQVDVPPRHGMLVLALSAVPVLMLAVVAHQYRTQNRKQGLVLVALLLTGTAGLIELSSALPSVQSVADAPQPDTRAVVDARFGEAWDDRGPLVTLGVVDPVPHERLDLASVDFRIMFADGTATEVMPRNSAPRVMAGPQRRLDAEHRWIAADSDSPRQVDISLSLGLESNQILALQRGDARLLASGRVDRYEARLVGRIPLEVGATAAIDGSRLRVLGVSAGGGAPAVSVQRTDVIPGGREGASRWAADNHFMLPVAALVHGRTGEAVALAQTEAHGGDVGVYMGTPRLSAQTVRFGPVRSFGPTAGPPAELAPEWLREARLALVQWVRVGGFVFETTVTDAGRAACDGAPR